MAKTTKNLEVVLHLVHDVVEDAEAFSSEKDALEYLSAECHEHFLTVAEFLDWQEKHLGLPDEYRWIELPREFVKELAAFLHSLPPPHKAPAGTKSKERSRA